MSAARDSKPREKKFQPSSSCKRAPSASGGALRRARSVRRRAQPPSPGRGFGRVAPRTAVAVDSKSHVSADGVESSSGPIRATGNVIRHSGGQCAREQIMAAFTQPPNFNWRTTPHASKSTLYPTPSQSSRRFSALLVKSSLRPSS